MIERGQAGTYTTKVLFELPVVSQGAEVVRRLSSIARSGFLHDRRC